MNYPLLRQYLLKTAANTQDPGLQHQLIQLLQQVTPDQTHATQHPVANSQAFAGNVVDQQQDDAVADPDMNRGLVGTSQNAPKEQEDHLMHQALPELQFGNPDTPEAFGKLGPQPSVKVSMWDQLVKKAAYIEDVPVSSLPAEVQKELRRFIKSDVDKPVVIHYGMTIKSLLPRVDPSNFNNAWSHVKSEMDGKTKADLAKAKEEVHKKVSTKYILMVNDQIVDGHHFLAKAKYFGLTNSLSVLDLTPVRFQS